MQVEFLKLILNLNKEQRMKDLTDKTTGITIDHFIKEWEKKYYRLFGTNKRKLLKERSRIVNSIYEPILVIACKRQALVNLVRKRVN